jgi:hypothetical protein
MLFFTQVFSKAGPPIPLPTISAENAIALARKTFSGTINNYRNANYFKEFIIASVEYNQDKENNSGKWVWQILFLHPIDNDCKWCYQIYPDKTIKLIYTTK